jgi:hypothetical protein
MIRLALTIGGVRITLFEIVADDDADTGPGASADVTLAPGFVPEVPWYDDEPE